VALPFSLGLPRFFVQAEAKERRVFTNTEVVLRGHDRAGSMVRKDSWISVEHGVEDGGRNRRLRLGYRRAHRPGRPRRGSDRSRPDIGQSDKFTIAVFAGSGRRCARQPTPDSFTDSRYLSHPGIHSIAKPGCPFARTLAQAGAAAIAQATASTTCEHMWSAYKSLGLQLLWREPHLQPTLELLLVLQLHTELLEEHGRLRG
jgi:hypothetical protein